MNKQIKFFVSTFFLSFFIFSIGAKTPLFQEIFDFDTAKLQTKIQSKPDMVNKADENGFTPLMEAAYVGNLEAVELLLKSGADINALSTADETVIMRAFTGYFDTSLRLNRMYITSRYKATKQNYGGLVAQGKMDLRDLGPLFNCNGTLNSSSGGISGLAINAVSASIDFKNTSKDYRIGYIEKNDLIEMEKDKENILKYEDSKLKSRYAAILKRLFELKPDLDKKTKSGYNPLISCAIAGDDDIFDLLVRSGADINVKFEDKYDLLFISSINGNFKVANYLKNKNLKSDLMYKLKVYIGFNDKTPVSGMDMSHYEAKEVFLKEVEIDVAFYKYKDFQHLIFCNIPKYFKITSTANVDIHNESDGTMTIIESMSEYMKSKSKYDKMISSGSVTNKRFSFQYCYIISSGKDAWQYELFQEAHYCATREKSNDVFLSKGMTPQHENSYFMTFFSSTMPYFMPGIFSLKYDSVSISQMNDFLSANDIK